MERYVWTVRSPNGERRGALDSPGLVFRNFADRHRFVPL